jgi:hypothetical protein
MTIKNRVWGIVTLNRNLGYATEAYTETMGPPPSRDSYIEVPVYVQRKG